MADIYLKTFRAAKKWARKHYEGASKYHVAAFANSVVYMVTGASTTLGWGPSIREHLTSWSLAGDGERALLETNLGSLTLLKPDGRITPPGEWDFDRACEYAAPICFGPLPMLAAKVYQQEYCFDDDPEDIAALALKGE